MPKCITCGLRTWFKPLDCDCKRKALKERARPVIPKTLPARHTPSVSSHSHHDHGPSHSTPSYDSTPSYSSDTSCGGGGSYSD